MKLQEIDWDNPAGASPVEVEYPDALIQGFMNWLRRTSAWREDPAIVERRVSQLDRRLTEFRNAGTPVVAPASTAEWLDQYMADPAIRADVEKRLKALRDQQGKANRAAALERARAKKAEKRAVPV